MKVAALAELCIARGFLIQFFDRSANGVGICWVVTRAEKNGLWFSKWRGKELPQCSRPVARK